jgi:CheY-like chemotaxis protein
MTLCLLGESDWFLARLLTRFGSACGMEITQVEVGEELLAMARRLFPAVIIADPDLPGAQRGWQAVQMLQADPQFAAIPIIAFTWLSREEACVRLGTEVGYLPKPDLPFEDFVTALNTAGIPVRRVSQE